MQSAIKGRIAHARDILVFPAWNWVALGAITLAGGADTVRAHFFHPSLMCLICRWHGGW
jgi:hypothetical protein